MHLQTQTLKLSYTKVEKPQRIITSWHNATTLLHRLSSGDISNSILKLKKNEQAEKLC